MISWKIKLVSAAAFFGNIVDGASVSSDPDSSVCRDIELLRQWPESQQPTQKKRKIKDLVQKPIGKNRLIQKVLMKRKVIQHEKVDGKTLTYQTVLPEAIKNEINGLMGYYGHGLNGVSRPEEFQALSTIQKIKYINQYMVRVTELEWYGCVEQRQFKCLKGEDDNFLFFKNVSKSSKRKGEQKHRIRWRPIEDSEILQRMMGHNPIRLDPEAICLSMVAVNNWKDATDQARAYLDKAVHKYPFEFAVWMWSHDPAAGLDFSGVDKAEYLFRYLEQLKSGVFQKDD